MQDGHDKTAAIAAVESQQALATPGAGHDRNPPLRIHPRNRLRSECKKPQDRYASQI
jgi:hypothetical protein